LAVDEALATLEELDPQQAKIVELRFFGGMSVEEVAEVLGQSKRTVERQWTAIRAWLRRELAEEDAV
jgi:RNA polymerase sigma factor (sigma-70 family)